LFNVCKPEARMPDMHPRLKREEKTIGAMVGIYCLGLHGTRYMLCPDCAEVLEYAIKRLDKCRFQADKPNCANCPVHCYKPTMRQKVRDIMRYSGPRMLYRHPVLALVHFFEGFRKPPEFSGKKE